ncbi:hypothetical protein DM01DRAFT_1340975 [Hesseltinella vesiculosa]|uniref:Pali-domain-containing protein n=1 Tax=Hesseltinella vesiculosa TaxID=101127 RepID=A0A1X2G2H1_9FUNG|nr:hypothetical protein DM01DRAFT_1340975 [Hesseltinella vesiculosa]
MGGTALHMTGLLFTVTAVVLLIFVNLGVTFNSTILPKIYLVQANFETMYIRFGPYNACLYNGAQQTCTKPSPGQSFDLTSFNIPNVDSTAVHALQTAYKFIVLVIPCTVMAFAALVGWMTIRRHRSSNGLPIFGAIASFIGMACGIACTALVVVCYQIPFNLIQTKTSAFTYQWGPALYMLGVGGGGCLLVSFVLYLISCIRHRPKDDYTYFQKEDDYIDMTYQDHHMQDNSHRPYY